MSKCNVNFDKVLSSIHTVQNHQVSSKEILLELKKSLIFEKSWHNMKDWIKDSFISYEENDSAIVTVFEFIVEKITGCRMKMPKVMQAAEVM